MKLERTERGFTFATFKDQYNNDCSIQKSSLATDDCIWLGCDNANPRVLVKGKGWQPVVMPDGYVADTRMHLTREQVAELLPLLQKFAETGELQ